MRPSVRVPVLSSQIVPGLESRCSTSPPLIRILRRAALPSATATASGVARASAHGHATMSRATAWSTATVGAIVSHAARVKADSDSTVTTNHPPIRSASWTIRGRSCCSTSASTLPIRVSSPTASTRI